MTDGGGGGSVPRVGKPGGCVAGVSLLSMHRAQEAHIHTYMHAHTHKHIYIYIYIYIYTCVRFSINMHVDRDGGLWW